PDPPFFRNVVRRSCAKASLPVSHVATLGYSAHLWPQAGNPHLVLLAFSIAPFCSRSWENGPSQTDAHSGQTSQDLDWQLANPALVLLRHLRLHAYFLPHFRDCSMHVLTLTLLLNRCVACLAL